MPARILAPDELDKAAKLIRDGRLVAFPTDTVYGVAALADEDLDSENLRRFKGGRPGPFSLHFGDAQSAVKFARPGGLVEPHALTTLTPRGVTVILADARTGRGVGCRVVRHEAGSALLNRVGGIVVATSANRHGEAPLADPYEIAKLPGLDAVLDGGVLPDRPASTVARLLPSGLEILREGAVPRSELDNLFTRVVEFVCLGNLNRSAFAAGLSQALQQWWGARIANSVPAFAPRSSGLIAVPGAAPPSEMVRAARDYGVDLSAHRATRFNPRRCAGADVVVSMGDDVSDTVRRAAPDALCWDVFDPMGGPDAGYQRTAREVAQTWLDGLARMPHLRETDRELEERGLKLFSGKGGQP